MRNFWRLALAVQTLLIFLSVFRDVSSSAIGRNDEPDKTHGLYNSSDKVVVLNATNFRSTVYNSKRSWLVEFYNSWCGYCTRFAPTWKYFANSIHSWNDIVVVAAIDCADDNNYPICREYEVMSYPLLKFFSADAVKGSLGIVLVGKSDINTVRKNLIERLEMEQQEGRGSNWPNIVPYRNADMKNIWKAVPEAVKFHILIFEDVGQLMGTEVILDLHSVAAVRIRRVTSENEPLCVMTKVTKFPSIVVFGRDESQKFLGIKVPSRPGIRKTIIKFLTSQGIAVNVEDIPEDHPTELLKVELKNHPSSDSGQEMNLKNEFVHQLDLETAVRYSLNHEIPLKKWITKERMSALKNYLRLLAVYFPMRQVSGKIFLMALKDAVVQKDSISGMEFQQLVERMENDLIPVYSGLKRWIGCKGSSEYLRGYPCGMWTIFHTLTVAAADESANSKTEDYSIYHGAETKVEDYSTVLRTIRDYMQNFFGCSDCAQHFGEMATKYNMLNTKSNDDSVLWLWRAHNRVNERLSGDQTEDPQHKKIQYPAKLQCPSCRFDNDTWNEEEVLKFLKMKYTVANIDYRGTSLIQPKIESVEQSGPLISQRKLGWDFTIFDISICVMLYIVSSAILILVCIKFAVKRNFKKKLSFRYLLTKV